MPAQIQSILQMFCDFNSSLPSSHHPCPLSQVLLDLADKAGAPSGNPQRPTWSLSPENRLDKVEEELGRLDGKLDRLHADSARIEGSSPCPFCADGFRVCFITVAAPLVLWCRPFCRAEHLLPRTLCSTPCPCDFDPPTLCFDARVRAHMRTRKRRGRRLRLEPRSQSKRQTPISVP